ncbi:hypothetical protein [Paenibacillus sp. PL91]|uniref:hypothetical protein n=1 Tax=Paenibacillus sp. PL91 TaxID=2729538 RepID=UPI00145C51FA|nr:hypothetical protein [Paenibacillus sp. PL91]MBC9204118.1 hypothetical protein [Paenibacillus sp. PL91]
MKKIVAKRKSMDSKPLLNKKTIIKKILQNEDQVEKWEKFLNDACQSRWAYIQILRTESPRVLNFNMRIDKVTQTTLTGKRVNITTNGEPGSYPDDYTTILIKDIFSAVCGSGGKDVSGDVVIICISGRGGGTENGMTKLVSTLRANLTKTYGINPQNIFHSRWNKDHNSDPFAAPSLSDLQNQINKRVINPSYLAIVGHSYGGWASCKLSRVTKKPPNFVGLIDPVFGPTNTLSNNDLPKGNKIFNWYQNNGISGTQCPSKTLIPCSSPSEGISCGYQLIPGVNKAIKVVYLKKWDNKTFKTVRCLGKTVRIRAYHTNIDDDDGVHRQIFDQINNDLKTLLKVTSLKKVGFTRSSSRKCKCQNRSPNHFTNIRNSQLISIV